MIAVAAKGFVSWHTQALSAEELAREERQRGTLSLIHNGPPCVEALSQLCAQAISTGYFGRIATAPAAIVSLKGTHKYNRGILLHTSMIGGLVAFARLFASGGWYPTHSRGERMHIRHLSRERVATAGDISSYGAVVWQCATL